MEATQVRRLALQVNNLLAERTRMAGLLGQLMNGRRDIYAAAGYPQALTFHDYHGAYRRQDIARRVVCAKPDEAWRLHPTVLDGADAKRGRSDTPFAAAVKTLATGASLGTLGDSFGLWHVLYRLDRVSGIGRYGVLFLGIRGNDKPSAPLRKGEGGSARDLLYLSVYDEAHAQIVEFDSDPTSPRFGLPLYYDLTVTDGTSTGAKTTRAHWSRCIHVAEGLDGDDIYGAPRLEACWNRMVDILKIMAGSGEAAWKLLDPGYTIRADEGKRLPTDEAQIEALEGQIEEFINGYTRWLLLEGMTPTPLPGSVQDPSGLVMTNVALISAATDIPQRILLGSERGELASTQDERNWATKIETRQVNHIEPNLIRPLLSRLVFAGVLPAPSSGEVTIQWPSLLESDRVSQAQTAKTAADALAAVGAKVDPKVFVETFLPELPVAAVEEAPEPVAALPQTTGERPEGEVAATNAAPFWHFADGWGAYP
jgi:hypothetical protein